MTLKNGGSEISSSLLNNETNSFICGELKSFRTSIGARTSNNVNHAANETKDAITSRIIQTVNMMKEVLQGNLGLRETI